MTPPERPRRPHPHPHSHPHPLSLPRGFEVGVATSAAQVEGAPYEDGRTASVWDTFAAQPGRILDGTTPSVACDQYHRFGTDLALMRRLGVDAYRFSLSWTRILPGGGSTVSAPGIAHYDRMIDQLLEAGIAPTVTLHHWDLPEELQRAGGWTRPDTAERLGELAAVCGKHFGDRVSKWITVNEPSTVALNGYGLGLHAPGTPLLFDAIPAALHQLAGHGHAVRALRAEGVTGQVGVTVVHSPVVPDRDRARDRMFARLFDVLHNRIFLDPVLLGRLPALPLLFRRLFASKAVRAVDLSLIAEPLDFLGVNYYMPTRIRAGSGGSASPDGEAEAMKNVPFSVADWPGVPTTGFGWPVLPEYFAVAFRELSDRYGPVLPPLYVTECGASMPDEVTGDGEIADSERIGYLSDHLQVVLATRENPPPGVDLRGFYVWSLLDNWEWAAGLTQRFGLVHVDFGTQRRTPKSSYHWLARALRERADG